MAASGLVIGFLLAGGGEVIRYGEGQRVTARINEKSFVSR